MTLERATELNRRDKAAHVMIPLPLHCPSACHLLSSRPWTGQRIARRDTCPKLRDVPLQAAPNVPALNLRTQPIQTDDTIHPIVVGGHVLTE